MNIVVCVKLTPDAGDIEVKSGGSISLERAEWIIGNFDLQAIEAGVKLAEAATGKVIVLSAGPHPINHSKLKKDLLSRGPDELVMVVDDRLANADTSLTSTVLAQAVRQIQEKNPIDLVLFGEGSADLYFQQTGLQVGEMLGWPAINAVSKIEVAANMPAGNTILLERDLEDGIEILEVPLPAALAVTTDINPPRLPTMKMILMASKKPVTEWTLGDLGIQETAKSQTETISTLAPHQVQRKNVIISGSAEEEAQQLVHYLNKEGMI